MKREQLEHVIRAAAAIAEDDEIVIVGSQSILGDWPNAPDSLLVSMDADVYPKNHPERANLIDGSIGEDSIFHQTFGYYAQGVGPETAVLPEGWERRLVAIRNANTRGATGWALDISDLAIAKYVAGRPKDLEFLQAAAHTGRMNPMVLRERLSKTPMDEIRRARIERQIGAHFGTD